MRITRRDFLKLAGTSAAALGLTMFDLENLEKIFASAGSPPVIWLQAASCTGCSISLLNAVNPTIDSVLMNTISMKYHPNLSTAAGDLAISTLTDAENTYAGQFVLVVEGGIPTANNGQYGIVGDKNGLPWTMLAAVKELGPKAKRVIAAGTCAAFKGVLQAGSNVTGVQSVKTVLSGLTSQPVINLPSCPVHPTILVGTLVDIFNGNTLTLDSYNRPTKYYGTTFVHNYCPRRGTKEVDQIGKFGCYAMLDCRGMADHNNIFVCPNLKWNKGINFCINTNVACIGCASPNFPYTTRLFNYSGGMGMGMM